MRTNERFFMKNKTKKILMAVLALTLLFSAVFPLFGCGDNNGAEPDANTPIITWKSDGLFALVPPPTKAYGKILTDTADIIEFETRYTQKSDFSLYVQLCTEKGFTSSVVNSEFFYSATDTSGYKISVQFNEARKTMKVTFDATNIKLTVPVSSVYFEGISKKEAIDTLTSVGFTNITFKVIEIEEDSEIENGTVESVRINSLPFEEDKEFRKSDAVTVRYYTRRIPFYWSEPELLGKHYTETEAILREAGFINITVKEKVIPIDYSYEESSHEKVFEVSVDGTTEFWYGSMYLPDSAVVISYYSYGVKGDYLGRDDKLSLYNYLMEMANVDLSKYSESKVARFRDAYDNANEVLNSPDSTELEVRSAMQELKNTYGKLAKFKTWQKVLLYIGIGVGAILLIGWISCKDDWNYEAYPWFFFVIGLILVIACILILVL